MPGLQRNCLHSPTGSDSLWLAISLAISYLLLHTELHERRMISADLQVYATSLVLGLLVPGLIFWMLYRPLASFLHAIFDQAEIERFWLRLTLLVFYAWTFAAAVQFHPDDTINTSYPALIFYLGDRVQAILHALLWSVLSVFLPLLLSYTILYRGRAASGEASQQSPGEPPGR